MIIQRKQTIAIFIAVFLLLAATFSFLQPVSYGAQSKVLVVQQYPQGASPYALSQAGSYLSAILAQVITTNTFYNEVVGGDFQVNQGYFEKNGDVSATTKNWQKAVSAKTIGDTGIIKIDIRHQDRAQSLYIADGISQTLMEKHAAFHGIGELVSIKVIDSPIVSQATPNLKLNFAAALAGGFALAIAYLAAFPEEKHQLRLFRKRAEKSRKDEPIDACSITEAMRIESK